MERYQDREEKIPELDFTQSAEEVFYDAVDDPHFPDQDLDVIYAALRNKIRIVPFGDFLKRYIYQKAEMKGDYQSIPLSDYQQIICDEFSERQTPGSFKPTSSRLRNLAKNWLEQKTVSRNVVLLLGFGLGMSAEDVNDFLTKALKEQRLNAKDPFEVICWYCYAHGLGYLKFDQLWKAYQTMDPPGADNAAMLESTFVFKQQMLSIRNEDQLRTYLRTIPVYPGTARQSVRARKQFDRLYAEVCDWVAEVLTGIEESNLSVYTGRLQEKLDRDDRYYDFQKLEKLEKESRRAHRYSGTEVKAADVEQVAFASIPKDQNGNLLPMKSSTLNNQFSGTRLSRQHISEILAGKGQITRYDLITLNFLAFSRKLDDYRTVLERYADFINTTNNMLEKSDMGPLYTVNPYESFILMCVLSEDPIGTFSDVWELSYMEE